MSREEAKELCLKAMKKTMQDLGKLEEAVARALNTKKDVKDSSRSLGTAIRTMMKYFTVLDKVLHEPNQTQLQYRKCRDNSKRDYCRSLWKKW